MRGFGSLPTASGGEPPSPPSSRFESRHIVAVALGWKLGRTLEEVGAPTLGRYEGVGSTSRREGG
jgi:hypothetical protein